MSIESELHRIKEWYVINYPLCLFCGHRVNAGDLAHLVRKSYSITLQTVKLNTGLAHRQCHSLFDDDPAQAIFLPRFTECMYIIWMLDQKYFNQISDNYPQLSGIFDQFKTVPYQNIEHHGELLQLDYLSL